MDQAQELSDGPVASTQHAVDLASLKAQYNFVGSYYFDIGLGILNQGDGTDSGRGGAVPQQLLAMGNEIGSHSYTHPENTNRLLPNVADPDQLDQIGRSTPTAATPAISPLRLARRGCRSGYRHQMRAMSLAEINQTLSEALVGREPKAARHRPQGDAGRDVPVPVPGLQDRDRGSAGHHLTGVAVPGMPDTLDTARRSYRTTTTFRAALAGRGRLSGRYRLPDARRYQQGLYRAEHVFRLHPAWMAATDGASGAGGVARGIRRADQEFGSADRRVAMARLRHRQLAARRIPSDYTLQMYTAFIAAAAQSGAEFVTLADLADRIAAFDKTSLQYTVTGDTIVAKVTPAINNLGTFALDFDSLGAKHIQSVTGWYAYDDNSVFLDADGGSFTVKLGTTTDDLTHITSIADRAKLMTLIGDGTNLSFTIAGEGKVVIDLKALTGSAYSVTGATIVSLTDEILTLDLGAIGTHAVTVTNAFINVAPSGADKTVTVLEDIAYTFSAADFGFTDSNGNTLSAVKITTLPIAGLLTLGGIAVTLGQSIPAASIGQLVWTPPLNGNGTGLGSFTFQVQDNGGTANGGVNIDPTPNTIAFNVTSVNDAPSGADKAIVVAQNGTYAFAAADFGFTDVDNNTLSAVKITTLPATGTLRLNGVVVTAGQSIVAASLPQLVWTPPLNGSGNALGSFTFQVVDNGGTANGGANTDPTPNTITFNVGANLPPVGLRRRLCRCRLA